MSCAGIPVTTDISGPGVRAALYAQSLLTVVLVRISPEDAPNAYWSMIATALSLITSSLVTIQNGTISLLDAIVVTYVLILPIVASAFGVAELAQAQLEGAQPGPNALRRSHSPLLILANWLRSALTYAFALYVWGKAPSGIGSGPPECDQATRLIFFGASLPALGSGRTLNLAGWGILTALFAWRTLKGSWTLAAALRGLFSESVMLKPKTPPKNVMNFEIQEKYDYVTRVRERTGRVYRPKQVFHEMLQGMMNQILGWAPSGQGRWYRKYGQLILATLISAWAITMTELELKMNTLEEDVDAEWGFGQILPLILTISPLFALYEALLKRRARGPLENSKRTLRFTIVGAHGLKRPRTEFDNLTEKEIDDLIQKRVYTEEQIAAIRTPSPFAVLSVDRADLYTTYDQYEKYDPVWNETFDATVSDTTSIVVRVFDSKCMARGWPALMGYTTIFPFAMMPPSGPEKDDDDSSTASTPDRTTPDSAAGPSGVTETPLAVPTSNTRNENGALGTARMAISGTFPLVLDRSVVPGASVEFAVSEDTSSPVPPPTVPDHYTAWKRTNVKNRVCIVKWRGRTLGGRRTTTYTETYDLPGARNEGGFFSRRLG